MIVLKLVFKQMKLIELINYSKRIYFLIDRSMDKGGHFQISKSSTMKLNLSGICK